MSRQHREQSFDESFVCARCHATIVPPASGSSQRNHCPRCLYSLHVDLRSGDRMCGCRGLMEPVGVWTKENGEWAIIHRCLKCGFLRANRIAADDDELRLFVLAARPLARLPFPYRLIDCLSSTPPGEASGPAQTARSGAKPDAVEATGRRGGGEDHE